MTSGYISQIEVDRLFFFFSVQFALGNTRLTLTADSVKNNSVKLSIKFMVLEIQSNGRRRFKIQESNVAICPQTTTSTTTTTTTRQVDRLKLL